MPVSLALTRHPLRPKRQYSTFYLLLQLVTNSIRSAKRTSFLAVLLLYVYIRLKRRRITSPAKFKSIAAYSVSLRRDRDFYDVAIVGGGVSGAATALHLARQGLKVIILEQSCPSQHCTEAAVIFGAAARQLKILGVYSDLTSSDVAYEVNNIAIYSSHESYEGSLRECRNSSLICVQRSKLTSLLVAAAERAGASIQMKTQIIFAEREDSEKMWTIHSQDGFFKAKMLICADGAESGLGRKLGLVDGPPSHSILFATLTRGTHEMGEKQFAVFSLRNESGFATLARLANDDLAISIYSKQGNVRYEDLIHSVLSDPRVTECIGHRAEISGWGCGALRSGGPRSRSCAALLIVGRAAAADSLISADTVTASLESAKMAAETVCDAFRHFDFSDRFLSIYHERSSAICSAKFGLETFAANVLHSPVTMDLLVRFLRKNGTSAFQFVAESIAGENPPSFWKNPVILLRFLFSIFSHPSGSN